VRIITSSSSICADDGPDVSKRPLSLVAEEPIRDQDEKNQPQLVIVPVDDEASANAPPIIPEILQHPPIYFQSEHPILKHLSNVNFPTLSPDAEKTQERTKSESSKIKDLKQQLQINPATITKAVIDPDVFKYA
jgi:hypothetical protein